MKKFFKILGLALAGLFGLLAAAVGIAAITGVFSEEEIKIESLAWEVTKARVVDDYTATVNFLPENANVLDIELKILTSGGDNIVELPKSVKAGEPFVIKVKKDANNNNIGGEVQIQAKTSLVVTSPNLQMLVDVAIPNNGLLIASDHDTVDDQMRINAGTNEFGLYVFTNPINAINPNTGLVPDLAEDYKDIQLKSTDPSALQLVNATGTQKEGFYCPNYIAHGHMGPFKDADGNPLLSTCTGAKLQKVKYIEYRAKPLTSTAPEIPVVVTAKTLRTYAMQDQYVSKDDVKYLNEDLVFDGPGRALFYQDLSNYVNEFKDYIIADTRACVDPQNPSRVTFENGAAFIESVTKTDADGNTYINIVDGNRDAEEAAFFYFYVESKTSFNIEDIEVKNVVTNLQSKVEYNLHGALEQYDINDLRTTFGLSLQAQDDEFDESDLAYRYRDLRVLSISDKAEGSESPYGFDINNYFEIQNPSSTSEPIWTIRAINPISSAERSKNPRLRFYIPTSPTKEFTEANPSEGIEGDPYVDVSIEIQEIQVQELRLLTDGENMIDGKMIINKQDYNGYSYRQILDSTRYELKGVNDQTPTYTTVRYFVTETSAKTKFEKVDTSFFKVRLNNDDKTPALMTMPYGTGTLKGYEIAYQFNGQTCLEALNITNGDDLKIFAAVIKTDYNGRPVDSNGVSEGEEGYNGIYQIIAESTNQISITIENYLEKLNFYTVNTDNNYSLRNVQAAGSSEQDTVQLLAGNDYHLYVSPYYLTKTGDMDKTNPEYANQTIIDYETNIKVAMQTAMNSALVQFKTDSSDFTYDVATILNPKYIFYDINVIALVSENANSDQKTTADFNAYGVGEIKDSFSSNKSTVNMYVNYSSIDSLSILANVSQKEEYVLYPQVFEVSEDGVPIVSWVEAETLENNQTDVFAIDTQYTFDIENLIDMEDGSQSFGPKVDKNWGTSIYVNDYIKEYLSFSNANAVDVSWDLEIIKGGTGEPVENFISIIQTEAPAGSGKRSITNLNVLKGTISGVTIQATCTLSLYKLGTDRFVEQKSTSIIIKLVQTEVGFKLYSPRKLRTGDSTSILVENGTGKLSYEVEGGGNDFASDDGGYNLLMDYGEQRIPVYSYNGISGEYENIVGETASQLVKVSMGEDGKLGLYCRYKIRSLVGSTPSIYFLDEKTGEKKYSAYPDAEGNLFFYAEYVSEDTTEVIEIEPPFNDCETGVYHVTVLSSISLTKPYQDIVANTTEHIYLDLNNYFIAKRDNERLITSFEITNRLGGNAFARMETIVPDGNKIKVLRPDGTIVEEAYTTKFIPHEVWTDKVVYLNMYYFVPQTINIDGTEETVYVKNLIQDEDINVIVKKGYEVENVVPANLNAETTTFKIKSGEIFNMFDTDSHVAVTTKNITSGFIKITNKYNMSVGVIDESQIGQYLSKLITLSYDVSALDAADLSIFNTLFDTVNSRNQIEFGNIITKSIASDITIPIKVLFKEGSNSVNGNYTATADPIFTFYVKIEASVDFYISDTIKPEGNDYITDAIEYEGFEVEGSQIGHTYSNINIDTDNDGVINLGEYRTTLFDVSKPYTENIISLRGTDNNELFNTMYKEFFLYKLVKVGDSPAEFIPVTTDDKVSILEIKSGNDLTGLVLNIKNAVNDVTHYKLAISTTINKYGETFDYYFTINPTYKLKINYPLVNEYEKVVAGTTVNLLENYINERDRIELYATFVLNEGEDPRDFIYSITKLNSTSYSLETSEISLAKTFEMTESGKPFKFEVISGSAHIENDCVVFDTITSAAQIEEVVVRVTLFNGVYVDYIFELYKQMTTPSFIAHSDIVEYADTEIDIYQYLELTSTPPESFKYVIKYVGPLKATVKGEEDVILNPAVLPEHSNIIIDYSGAEIRVKFEDTDEVTTVMFKVWTNYSVSGDDCVILSIKLHPNLQVSVNKAEDGSDKVTELVANTSQVIMSSGNDSWLKIANDRVDNISITVVKVDDVAYDMGPSSLTNNLGITISQDSAAKTYTFKTNNIGVARMLTFKIEKQTGTLTYSIELSVKLVPNINLNSSYIGTSTCEIKAASGNDQNKSKQVTLNDVQVDDGFVISPTDYFGSALKKNPGSNESNEIADFTINCYVLNNIGTKIQVSEADGVSGYGVTTESRIAINLSLEAINYTSKIYIDITVTWSNGVEAYNATLNLNIVPNIDTATESVSYSSAGSTKALKVLAGSKIEMNFAQNSPVVFTQNGQSATINAFQTLSTGGPSNANVIFKVENNKDDLYEFGHDGFKPYIQFKGVTKTEVVHVFYYLDLTGKRMGLWTENNSLKIDGKIDFIDFNNQIYFHYDDQNKNPNLYSEYDEKLANYARVISFEIVPSITSMEYKDSNNKHDTVEKVIDLTDQFKKIYAVDNSDPDNIKDYLTINNTEFTINSVNNHTVVLTNNNGVEVNGYKIVDLFTYSSVGYATFDAEEGKVNLNKALLYSAFDYSAVVKLGNFDTPWDSTSEMISITEPEEVKKYFFVDKPEGIIYFIPPKGASVTNSVWLEITITTIGDGDVEISNKVYFKYQYTGTQDTADSNVVQHIGNGTEIISVGYNGKVITDKAFTNINSQEYRDYLQTSIAVDTAGIDLNTGIMTYDLSKYFKFGYLLRTIETSSVPTSFDSTKNVQIVQKTVEGKTYAYYFYMLNEVSLNFDVDGDSSSYAKVENGQLIIYPYYINAENPSLDKFRTIKLNANAGNVLTKFEIEVYPIKVTQTFTHTPGLIDGTFDNSLTSSVPGVNITSNTVQMQQGSLTSAEYNEYKNWLWIDGGVYKFTPQKNLLMKPVEFVFENQIVLGSDLDTTIFTKTCRVQVDPTVGLYYNYEENGVQANSNTAGTAIYYTLVDNSATSLFNSKVFDYTESATVVTLRETSTEANYDAYVQLDGVSPGAEDTEYIIDGRTAKMTMISQQLLEPVILPYEITIEFDNNGDSYVLTKEFDLVINRNSGVFGFEESYTGLSNVVVKKDNAVSSAIISLPSSVLGGNVKKVGTGVIEYGVASGNFGFHGTSTLSTDQIRGYLDITDNIDINDGTINSITIDYTRLLTHTGSTITGMYKIELLIYYKKSAADTERVLVDSVVLESQIVTTYINYNFATKNVEKGTDYLVFAKTNEALFDTDMREPGKATSITLYLELDNETDKAFFAVTNETEPVEYGASGYLITNSNVTLRLAASAPASISAKLKIRITVGTITQDVVYEFILSVAQ